MKMLKNAQLAQLVRLRIDDLICRVWDDKLRKLTSRLERGYIHRTIGVDEYEARLYHCTIHLPGRADLFLPNGRREQWEGFRDLTMLVPIINENGDLEHEDGTP
jgi:hypothetical protein